MPLTAPVVDSGLPELSTSWNEPWSTRPPLCDAAVALTGVSVTWPTYAPEGMPLPETERPSSVTTIELSAIVVAADGALAPASARVA